MESYRAKLLDGDWGDEISAAICVSALSRCRRFFIYTAVRQQLWHIQWLGQDKAIEPVMLLHTQDHYDSLNLSESGKASLQGLEVTEAMIGNWRAPL